MLGKIYIINYKLTHKFSELLQDIFKYTSRLPNFKCHQKP